MMKTCPLVSSFTNIALIAIVNRTASLLTFVPLTHNVPSIIPVCSVVVAMAILVLGISRCLSCDNKYVSLLIVFIVAGFNLICSCGVH